MKKWAILDPYIVNSSRDCIDRIIARHQRSISFDEFIPSQNELPKNNHEYCGFISLGSSAFASDNHPWINNLGNFLKNQLEQGKKVLGICFSHQLIIKMYGGEVIFNFPDKRPIKGAREVKLTNDLPPFKNNQKIFLAYGQQQRVSKIPPDFYSLGSSLYDFEILKHRSLPFLGLQAHPEASRTLCQNEFEMDDDNEIQKAQSFGDKIIDHFVKL